MENKFEYQIRSASTLDIASLVDFGKAEFCRTFGHLYTNENLQTFLSESYTYEKYEVWVTDTEKYFIRIAFSTAEPLKILGYILCGPCGLPLPATLLKDAADLAEIKRLYILPECFGSGIAQELVMQSINWFLDRGLQSKNIYLGVFSENFRAQKFYAKQGFVKIGEYQFQVGDGFDREFILQYNR